ncbi:anti-sigma factor antagonist [Nocardioides seonyuensis]|uniref:Anti-sigma factor antagonist n=1 Tax=Nocardioides seonyuensis TaxID=2518371 RepID=A0A4P7ID82_9ACTN|nr:STAS domain-containing protein [Nocardioides seonyuensis]QBX55028.1 anti-sigma factor antagonist [Nocardioides seonyuensis]
MDLNVETRFENGYAVVRPSGEIDLSTVEQFREVLRELIIRGHAHVLVDMDDIDFIDSLGFGVLVAARRKARAFNGSLGIVCSAERVLRLFKVTALDRVFTITASVSEQPALPGAELMRTESPAEDDASA